MINPFFCYIFSFIVALLIYSLGWSELYPSLSFSLLGFLFITFIIHFVFGYKIQKSQIIRFTTLPKDQQWPVGVTLFIYILWIMEFFYEGGIPVLKIILNQPYNYRLFGIPSLHVFAVTFSSFYTVYLFQLFLSHKSTIILLLFLINLLAALLIYSRAMLFFNLTSCLFIYIIYSKGISYPKILYVSLALIPLFYLFGFLGSLRVSREAKESYNNENFMEIGKATNEFRKSVLPKEYFWAYIYISSPIANLQKNVCDYPVEAFSIRKFAELINSEVFPDFLSKRINSLFKLDLYTDKRIPGPFNVSTIYSRSYSYAGWVGMALMAGALLLFPLLFLKLLPPSSDFFISGWAILCTMYLFLVYDNTLRFTGLSFQLVYPVILNLLYKRVTPHLRVS